MKSDKIFGAAVAIFIIALYLFMQLSAHQVFHNFYQLAAHEAPGIFRVIGSILTLASVYTTYKMLREDSKYKIFNEENGGITLFILAVVTFFAYVGFYS